MKKILDYLEKLIRTATTFLFFGIAGLIAVQVFTRYVMQSALSWSEQAARAMFIWMVLLYASILVRKSLNLGFDLIINKLPKVYFHMCKFLCEISILAFSGYWSYQGLMLCISFADFRLSGLHLPYNAIYSAEPIGAALIFIFSLELIVKHIRELTGKEANA